MAHKPKHWDEKRFYLRALALPVLLPLSVVAAYWVIYQVGLQFPYADSIPAQFLDLLYLLSFVLIMSGIVGGIPYLLIIGSQIWFIRNRSVQNLKNWIVTLPCQLAILTFAIYSITDNTDIGFKLGTCSIVIGYLYILAVFGYARYKKRSIQRTQCE